MSARVKFAAPKANPGPGPAASTWILSPLQDSLLFIGSPVVAIATLLPLRSFWSSQDISVFLLAFFTFGHHFPGFLRAYGDRELFARYRWRFLLAPLVLFGAAVWFDSRGLHGLLIFLSLWDIWHVLMQHYGFMRIYDAKARSSNPSTARLDRAVSLCWYLTLIFWSPHYAHELLRRAYLSGLPLLPPALFGGLQTGLAGLTAVLSIAYLAYHWSLHRKGQPVSFQKIALLAVFLSATFYLYVFLDDFLVGFAVWSAFHCLQYYGIVWVFNRNRVAKGGDVRGLLRFLFRPSSLLVALYVALILAYGGINYVVSYVSSEQWRRLLIAFTFTSAALHYYYDGFIWKVQESATRQNLDIAGAGMGSVRKRNLVQPAYLAAVVFALAMAETHKPQDEMAMLESLTRLVPRGGAAHFNLGVAQWKRGELDAAIEQLREAIHLMPASPEAHNNLGAILHEKGKLEEAILQYQQALEIRSRREQGTRRQFGSFILPASLDGVPNDSFATRTNLADALTRLHRFEEAVEHYRQALEMNPDSSKVRTNLGAALMSLGRDAEAIPELQRALQDDPAYSPAHLNLGLILSYQGKTQPARAHLLEALNTSDERARRAAEAALGRLRAP